MTLINTLQTQFPHLVFQEDFVLAPLTTVKIGGPAEVFCETKTRQEFIDLVMFAKQSNIPLTLIGWGANTLISDHGVQGLVIKNLAKDVTVLDEKSSENTTNLSVKYQARWNSDAQEGSLKYQFTDLDYDESNYPRVKVEMDSGVALPFAMNHLINQGITGLQWYARIPATVGGAIFNNIHGGTHFIEEVLESVQIIDVAGNLKTLPVQELEMDYDYSRFHYSQEVIVSATFSLYRGDAEQAKKIAQEWAVRKAVQPANSLGCVFQNISNEQREALDYPTTSVGYIVEHILGKKGFQIGDAKVSEKHSAFIENVGKASADDYLQIIRTIIKETKDKTGITLKPEIFFVGFSKQELEGVME